MTSSRTHWTWAGIAGPALFTFVWLLEGALRPDYSPTRNWISELALTGRGWILNLSLLLSGALLIAFARSLRHPLPTSPAATWGPRLVATTGVAQLAAGVFVIDPTGSYPPGVTPVASWHGILHDVAGAVFFLSLTLTAVVYARRLATPFAKRFALASGTGVLSLWLAASVLSGLDHAGAWPGAPAGLAQRAAMLSGFAFLAYLARKAPAAPSILDAA